MALQAASGLLSAHAFDLVAPFAPTGDQPSAIAQLAEQAGTLRFQTLQGATGTGKTFVMGQLIQRCQKPALLLAPNKVLAAQLFHELSELFPANRVEYFVSYYDYFRPESYNSSSDLYLEKVSQVNADIDRMRHSATRSLFERPDTIVVASISCIYGLGMPEDYLQQVRRAHCNAIHDNAVQCNAITHNITMQCKPHHTQCNAIQHNPMQCNQAQYNNAMQYNTMQHAIPQHNTTQYNTIPQHTRQCKTTTQDKAMQFHTHHSV